MKLRKAFTLALLLLLVFGFCLSLIAEPTVDEARDDYLEAMHYYEREKRKTDEAETNYLLSNDAVGVLDSALNLKKSEVSSKKSGIIDKASKILKAVGADPADIISDAAAIVLDILKDGWDYNDLREERNNIQSALSAQTTKNEQLRLDWQTKKAVSDNLWNEAEKAFAVWQALKAPLTYSLSAPSVCFEGDLTECSFSINRVYEWVKWYVKSPGETGLGTLMKTETVVPDDYPKVVSFGFTVPTGSGNLWDNYVITAVARVASTGEEVSESSAVTVVKEGVYTNKTTRAKNYTSVVVL